MKKDKVPYDYIEVFGLPHETVYVDQIPYYYLWFFGECCFNLEFYDADEVENIYWSVKVFRKDQNLEPPSKWSVKYKQDHFWGKISLDDLLGDNRLPADIAEKILFNLDLFI